MPEHEIKTRVSVDGEQGYRQAIKSARDQLKLLEAQLKQATSAMGRNASEQDKAAKKADTLRLKIEQQKKIIEQTQKALMQASQKYGENSAAAVQWQTRLANAQTVLNNMNNELDGLTNGLRESGDAFREAGESAGESAQQTANFAEGIKGLANVAKGVGNDIKGVFDKTLQNIRWVTDEVVSMINVATGQVDQWKGITDVYGGSAEGVQKWLYGTSAAGLKYSDTTGALSHFVQAVDSDAAAAEDALKKLELVQSDYDNHWDFFMATLERLNAYQGDDKGTLVTALFGKGNYASVMTMMTKWDSMMTATQKAEDNNLFIDPDTIEQVDAFQEKVNLLLTTVTDLQTLLGSQFIMKLGLTDIVEHATDTIVSLANLFSAISSGDETAAKEARIQLQANLQILSTDLTNALNSLNTWVGELSENLKLSDNPALQTIGRILEKLNGTLKWVLDWLEDPANQEIIANLVNWMLTDWAVKAVTGNTIEGWIEKILNALLEIGSYVMLIAGVRNTNSMFKLLGGGASPSSGYVPGATPPTPTTTPVTPSTPAGGPNTGITPAQATSAIGPSAFSSFMSYASPVLVVAAAVVPAALNQSDYESAVEAEVQANIDAAKTEEARAIAEKGEALTRDQDSGNIGDAGSVHRALMEIYESGADLPGQAKALLWRAANGGLSMQAENDLLRNITANSNFQSTYGADLQGTIGSALMSIYDLTEGPYGPTMDYGNLANLIRTITGTPELMDYFSDETMDRLGAWYDPESGMTSYSYALELLDSIQKDLGGAYLNLTDSYWDRDDFAPGDGNARYIDLTDAAANKIAAAVAHMPIDMDGQRVANLVSQHMAANV